MPNWLYITDDNIAPVLVGEWGGFLDGGDNERWMGYLTEIIAQYGLNHTFWCVNPNSGDTGGILLNDWVTVDTKKYNLIEPSLWKDGNGKYIGLDHQVDLGADGTRVGENSPPYVSDAFTGNAMLKSNDISDEAYKSEYDVNHDGNKTISSSAVIAAIDLRRDWGWGYYASVTLKNAGVSEVVTDWTIVIEMYQSTLNRLWGATYTRSGSRITVRPSDWNAEIAPGDSVSFGIRGNGTGLRPKLDSLTITGDDGTPNPAPGTYACDTGESTTVPASNTSFIGWSGTAMGMTAPASFTGNVDKTPTAIFPDGDSDSCPHGLVKPEEVVWIGDSWFEIPGTQHTTVRDLARAAGVLGSNEDYVDLAVGGSTIQQIVHQYNTRQAGSTKVKVLIMDGGGIDLILADGSKSAIDHNVSVFKTHLAKIARDGTVEHIIYQLYPELPITPNVAGLRSGMQAACEASTVPCYFLDLQPVFQGHPEYTGSDQLYPSISGGVAIGKAIWDIMQKNCIAQ
jgi:hypothetical protein